MNYFFTNNICIFTMIETYFKNIQISQIHSKRLNSKKNFFFFQSIFFPSNISTVSTIIKSKPQQKKNACANKIELSRALFFSFLSFYQNSPQGVKVNPRCMYFIQPISMPSRQWKRKIDRPIKRYDTREIYGPTHKCLHDQTWIPTNACTHEQWLKASSIKLFEGM